MALLRLTRSTTAPLALLPAPREVVDAAGLKPAAAAAAGVEALTSATAEDALLL
jgi:hypothetical protein